MYECYKNFDICWNRSRFSLREWLVGIWMLKVILVNSSYGMRNVLWSVDGGGKFLFCCKVAKTLGELHLRVSWKVGLE